MAATLFRTVAPALQPVTLAEIKRHVRADDFDDDDTDLQSYLDAAVSYLDGHGGILGRAMMTQTWKQVDNARVVAQDGLKLRMGPVQSLTTITYYDQDWSLQNADASDFDIVHHYGQAFVVPRPGQAWPSSIARDRPDALQVAYLVGFGSTPADVPDALKHAIKLLVGHWYENREAVTYGRAVDVPFSVMSLINQHKSGFVG